MKNINKITFLIAIGTLIVGVLLGWVFFGGPNEASHLGHDHPTSEEGTIWTCSMHPQIRQNEPGDCPICGMDLIPLAADQGEELDPMAVSMSPTAMQLAQVETMIVGEGKAEKLIQLNGKVQADERMMFTQSSHIPGRIERLSVNFTGEYVSAGQVIAHVYSPELVTAQEELFEARKVKDSQPALYRAAIEKLKNWKLSTKQINQILASERAIEEFPVLANISGYVTKRKVNLGDYIKRGEAIYEVADLSKVWVMFDVYESDMSWIKEGASISYSIPSLPGKSFKAVISYIDPVIDPKTRVAQARVETSNTELLLKPEMFANGLVNAQVAKGKSSLTVPKSAVMWTGKRSVVYVMKKTTQEVSFQLREVTLGAELGEGYVIESGLIPGEEIAVRGTFSIDAAAQLAGKPSMMNREGGVSTTGHDHGGNAKVETPKVSASPELKKVLKPLFIYYLAMKDALVKDDFKQAQQAGKDLKKALIAINASAFKGEARGQWDKQSAALKQALEHVEHLSDLKALRESFIPVSNALIAMAQSFGPMESIYYVQHCPMADANKGADWLSAQKEIRNPYFGQGMLTCGSVTKTLARN